MIMRPVLSSVAVGIGLVVLVACGGDPQVAAPAPDAHAGGAPVTNRIELPPAVRQNLGITFATAEYRPVAATVRVPGRFELRSDGQRQLRAPFAGRILRGADLLSEVAAGTVLYELDSPQWSELQAAIEAAVARISAERSSLAARRAEAAIARVELAAVRESLEEHRKHHATLVEGVTLWERRVSELETLRAQTGGLAAELTQARADLIAASSASAEAHEKMAALDSRRRVLEARLGLADGGDEVDGLLAAQITAAEDAVVAAEAEHRRMLRQVSTLSGISLEELQEEVAGVPRWQQLQTLPVRSDRAGIVQQVAAGAGAWVERGEAVLTVADPRALRFRAKGLQGDLPQLQAGSPARIVPGQGQQSADLEPLRGRLQVSLDADPQTRTVDLIVVPEELAPWARPGVSAYLEYLVGGSFEDEELAIPQRAVIRDGLERVVFRRDPANPDQVIRLPADLGESDGRWVTVRSGLAEGDQVVLDGIYELKLSSGSTDQQGGHFHADGTWHPEH
jgi:multidrug resistance efflux pump